MRTMIDDTFSGDSDDLLFLLLVYVLDDQGWVIRNMIQKIFIVFIEASMLFVQGFKYTDIFMISID